MTVSEAVATSHLRLGTRRSALALAQSGQVARQLEAFHPGLTVELVAMVTTGDVVTGDLAAVGGKGLFTLELERGLLDGSLDFAVHSLKDLPVTLPEGLVVAAHPVRADPRDVLVSEAASDLDSLPEGALLLTGALRRQAQIRLRRPDLRVESIRGNVDTRLRKWRESGAAGVILAAAGLKRLGLAGLPVHPIDPAVLIPAPGQGTLALEVRAGSPAEALCRALDHAPSARAAQAERRVVAAFGADCTLPLAAWAREEDGRLRLTALLALPDGSRAARGEGTGATPEEAAEACVTALKADGADEVLARLGKAPGNAAADRGEAADS
jgi:hydroxymethylbilane synthase